MRRLFSAALAAALIATAPSAIASPESEARATKLFDEGRKERDAGHYDRALVLFRQSAEADPAFGAYFNQGICFEQLGKDQPARLHDAVDAYKQALDFATKHDDPRATDARDAIAKLRDTHNYVFLQVPQEALTAPGLRINIDGDVVSSKYYNADVYLKRAGDHEVVIAATDRKDVRLVAQNRRSVAIVLGGLKADAPGPPHPPPPPPDESTGGGWGWQKWTGAGVATTGAVFFVVGVVKAFWYLGYASDESQLRGDYERESAGCKRPREGDRAGEFFCKDPNDVQSPDDDQREERVKGIITQYNANEKEASDRAPSTIAFGAVGAVMIGVGAYLFFSAPSGDAGRAPETTSANDRIRVRLVPKLSTQENGLLLVGTF